MSWLKFGPRRRRVLRRAALSLAMLLAAIGAYLGYVHAGDNFHAVVEGELYRSAQPTPEQLARYQALYGIRTVINLRGEATGKPWYDAEIDASKKLGITHVDFRMRASRIMGETKAQELIALLARAEKPILVHCRSGADRSGLAAALYVAAVVKGGEFAAERQLSILYGHLSIPFTPGFAMYETFESLEPMLGFPNS